MADETDDEQRRALEEFQRQQAEKARQESQGQPNAIPNEQPQANRGVDYAQRGLIPTIEPNAQGGFDVPQGVAGVAVQGSPLSDQETQFWQANPLGAVKDPVTGNLIGLGDTPARQQQVMEAFPQRSIPVNSGVGAPMPGVGGYDQRVFNPASGWSSQGGTQQPQQREIPNFVNIPEVDPNIGARRNQIAQSIADIDRRLPSASTNRVARGQPSERERLIMERAHYVRADDVLANELHNQTQMKNHASILNQKMQDQHIVSQDATALREDLNKLKSQFRVDDPRYALGIIQLRRDHPDALREDEHSKSLVDKAARAHEDELAFQQRVQGIGGVPTTAATKIQHGGVTYTIPSSGTGLSAKTTKQIETQNAKVLAGINLTPEQFAQRQKVERGTYPVDGGKITDASGFKGKDDGPHVRVTIGGQQYALSNADYQRLNSAVPQANAQPTPQAAATAAQNQEVIRATADGRQAVFDAATKKFLRYAQ